MLKAMESINNYMNKCQDCNSCNQYSKNSQNIENQNGYVKFKDDQDEGMWFHGLVYQRALQLNHFPREKALQMIRKEFGISP